MHLGAPQSDGDFIDAQIERAMDDPNGYVVYMGDGGECVTKMSKGDIFTQTLNPTEQLKLAVSIMRPLAKANKLLFAIDGNHGKRTFKETGLSWDESLALALGIPYFGTAVFWHLKVNRTVYSIYTHHGLDSGVNVGTKINKAKALENIVIADAILSAHSHIAVEVPPCTRAYLDSEHQASNPIRYITTHEYIVGCAYDSREGYAEDKGYPPILPAYMMIEFDGKIVQGNLKKGQRSMVWRKEA